MKLKMITLASLLFATTLFLTGYWDDSYAALTVVTQPVLVVTNPIARHTTNVTASFIKKGDVFSALPGMETTPVVFNGELLYVSAMLEPDALAHDVTLSPIPIGIVIIRKRDAKVLATMPGMEYVSAFVNKGVVYVFGTTNHRKSISVTSSRDLVVWTKQARVYTAQAGRHVFNTSVSTAASGYIMAYEVCDDGHACFNSRFLHSTDMISWTDVGFQYERGIYTACPTIRFVDGHYYMFFLSARRDGGYETDVVRSVDLEHWQLSPITALAPDDGDVAGNASDMDFVELNGKVRIVYSNMNQQGRYTPGAGMREASFNGTLRQFVSAFY